MPAERSVLNMRVGSRSAGLSLIQCLAQGRGVCVIMSDYRHNWLPVLGLEEPFTVARQDLLLCYPPFAPPIMKVEQRGRV